MSADLTKYNFEAGIPGFEQLRHFVFEDVGDELPMKLMKAEEDPNISLLVVSPFLFYPEYEWELAESVKQELDIREQGDVEIWSIITIPTDPSKATINLLAPILLNTRMQRGKQLILHDHAYSTRAPLARP
ncbi:flagellar assembly protein FliW [Paenibacillus sp. HB172176]|uniref:flagellar assembly protein FliW n=1 Tax=Paenibacillus sp. HB172176 TaxID=2493690 RepID=UPI001F0CE52A|nr:flagellar assembly protein FliW [Paenibacillus sp. HB172176]